MRVGQLKNIAIAVLAVIVGFLALKAMLPSLFDAKPIVEEDRSADVDMPVVIRVKGGMLEVATLKNRRSFSGASDPTILGMAIPYCREKSVWHANYSITYRVRLGERWAIQYAKGRLIARAPELEPALPVAIDTRSLVNTANEKCWFAMSGGTKDRVLKRISSDLEKTAKGMPAKNYARTEARQTIVEFIRTWAFNQKDYPSLAPDAPISVIFPGE